MAEVEFNGFRSDDIVIMFMGLIGNGMSSFVDLLVNQPGHRSGHTLESVTTQIQAVRVQHPIYNDRVVLIDTPGFNHTARSDRDIPSEIYGCLRDIYKNGRGLSGLIYPQRISDNRFDIINGNNLDMLNDLCSNSAMHQVVFVSTMWDQVESEDGRTREKALEETLWKTFSTRGPQRIVYTRPTLLGRGASWTS